MNAKGLEHLVSLRVREGVWLYLVRNMGLYLFLFLLFFHLVVFNNGEVQNIPCKSNSTIVNLKELIRTNSTVNIDAVHFTHIMKCGGSTIDDMLWRSKFANSFELVSTEAANTLPSALFGSIASKYDIIPFGSISFKNILL